jgi:transposase InsO family protein
MRYASRWREQHRATQRRAPASTTPADPDAALRTWLRDWAKAHPRRGFRNAHADARGEAWNVNHKKVQRLWREEGLRVPQPRRRKRVWLWTSSSTPPLTADRSRTSPSWTSTPANASTGLVDRSITADRLIDELDRIALDRYPAVLRCDNGPEPACSAMANWAGERV